MMEKKIPLNFESYPHLWELFEEDREQFATIVKGMLINLDKAVGAKHHKVSKKVFKRDYPEFVSEIIDAFLDYEGIAEQHNVDAEAESMKQLEHDLNPISIFTNGSPAFNAKGEYILPKEWAGMESFNLKTYVQNLLYGARYVSLGELANFLSLDQFEMIDILKARNLPQLLDLQPALDWQKENGIPVGKLIPGTGFFDCGTTQFVEGLSMKCDKCESEQVKINNTLGCLKCKAGYVII